MQKVEGVSSREKTKNKQTKKAKRCPSIWTKKALLEGDSRTDFAGSSSLADRKHELFRTSSFWIKHSEDRRSRDVNVSSYVHVSVAWCALHACASRAFLPFRAKPTRISGRSIRDSCGERHLPAACPPAGGAGPRPPHAPSSVTWVWGSPRLAPLRMRHGCLLGLPPRQAPGEGGGGGPLWLPAAPPAPRITAVCRSRVLSLAENARRHLGFNVEQIAPYG